MSTRNMVVSLIGRPNVGKSSLFNRLMRKGQKALTYDKPGVTRDRHYGIATFENRFGEDPRETILVDTGGFYPDQVSEDAKRLGQEEANANHFFNIMTDHAQLAIDESDLVLFVADVREGLLPFDKSICDYIRSKKKKMWLLVNKFDDDSQWGEEVDFYSLGLKDDQMHIVSAEHNRGLEELRERIHEEAMKFESSQEDMYLQRGVTPREEVVAKVSIIGRPNAGKSTLLNQLVGAERALVSNIAGTTVDPIEAFFDLYFGQDVELLAKEKNKKSNDLLVSEYENYRRNNPEFVSEENINNEELEDIEDSIDESVADVEELEEQIFSPEDSLEEVQLEEVQEEEGSFWRSLHLIDTAGIRKQKMIIEQVEEQSVFRSLRCITESDIVIHLVDATLGIGHQDRRLIDIALEKGKSVIVCLNKIDLMAEQLKTDREKREWILDLRAKIPWLAFCDVIPISAKKKQRIGELKKALKKTVIIRNRKVTTGELNRLVTDLVDRNPIYVKKSNGKTLRVKYASMIKSGPPTFLLFTNKSKGIPENYKKYLKNSLRRELGLDNTPVHLIFRTGFDLEKRAKEMQSNRT